MTTAVQHRRGTTAEHSTFTGLEGEVTIDTTKDTAVIHDGTLAGGYPLAKENLANVTTSGLSSIDGASTASDDKFFIYDQSATTLKTITRAELNNAIEQDALANVAITGGTINGTAIGGTTAAAGAFTTLSASSTVSGTGFSTYLASPPAIGGTAAAAGSFTTLSASGNVTLSGGTANGVAYLNGSKVVTSGSALTFDGTNLGVGGSLNTASGRVALTLNATTDTVISFGRAGTSVGYILQDAGGQTFYNGENTYQRFYVNAAEQMRLTSTGLAIGTTSFAGSAKLQVAGGRAYFGSNDTVYSINLAYNNTRALVGQGYYLGATDSATPSLVFSNTDGTARATLDYAGNLGLGVTPSAWGADNKTIQLPAGSISSYQTIAQEYAQNCFFDGTNWKYVVSTFAERYTQYNGQHQWFNAASGTAGNAITFTQAMTLDASGNLLVGTTSLGSSGWAKQIRLQGVGNAAYEVTDGTVVTSLSASAASIGLVGTETNHPLVIRTNNTERARIDLSGNLQVGLTGGSARVNVTSGASQNGINIIVPTVDYFGAVIHNQATSGDNVFMAFGTEASFTFRGSITYNRTGGLTAYNTTSDYRAKDIIGSVTNSGSVIDSVPVYMGKMHGATQERPMFIAHETPEYAHTGEKDAVDADGNPVYQQMDASALIPVMWAEIQSLRQRVAQLESN